VSENQAVAYRFQTTIQSTSAKKRRQNLAASFTDVLARKKNLVHFLSFI